MVWVWYGMMWDVSYTETHAHENAPHGMGRVALSAFPTQSYTHITLNLTILQTCIPTCCPAPFQAGSVSADDFFT